MQMLKGSFMDPYQKVKKTFSTFLSLFIFTLVTILPLYMADGYYELGEEKAKMYGWIITGGMVLTVPFLIILLYLKLNGSWKIRKVLPKRDMIFILCLLISVEILISYSISIDRKTALLGMEGWRNGLLVQLSYIAVFLLIRFFSEKTEINLITGIPTAFAVALMGIFNRFGLFNVALSGDGIEFLSTIGNINWFCGYISVFVVIPIGIMISSELTKYNKALLYGLIFIFTICIYTQGGSSIFLSMAAIMPVTLIMASCSRTGMDNLINIIIIHGAGIEAVFILMKMAGERYTYDAGNIGIILAEGQLGIILVAAGVYLKFQLAFIRQLGICRRKREKHTSSGKEKTVKRNKIISKIMLILPYAIIAILVIEMVVQLSGSLSDSFGNSRGYIWRITRDTFLKLPLFRKIFGAGPDCYYEVTNSIPEIRVMLQEQFGSGRLTNAHSGLLTMLINEGAAGVTLRLLLYFLVIKEITGQIVAEYGGESTDNPDSKRVVPFTVLLIMISYITTEAVLFEQPSATSFLFIFMGLGAKRRIKDRFR